MAKEKIANKGDEIVQVKRIPGGQILPYKKVIADRLVAKGVGEIVNVKIESTKKASEPKKVDKKDKKETFFSKDKPKDESLL